MEHSTLIIDASRDGFVFHRVSTNRSVLALRSKLATHARRFELTSNHISSSDICILGQKTDLFSSDPELLGSGLEVLKFCLQQDAFRIIIQTRSPLCILALPLLKNPRVEVRMLFETECDQLNAIHTPWLPRPSERLEACTVLTARGISTRIEFRPIWLRSKSPENLREVCETMRARARSFVVRPGTDFTGKDNQHLRDLFRRTEQANASLIEEKIAA